MAPNVGGGVATPMAYGWPQIPFFQPGMPGIPWFTGNHVHQFLEDYEALAARMQYTNQQKARHVINYMSPELKDRVYYTIQYEDEDWAALKAHLIKRFDSQDRPRFRQELERLVKEKWRLEDVEKNSDKFTYLWRRAHGKAQDDDRKTSLYLEALPDELVWAASNEIHDGADIRPFAEVLETVSVRAKQMLNIRRTRKKAHQQSAPQNEDVTEISPFETATHVQKHSEKAASADLSALTEQFQKLALQVKKLQDNSEKVIPRINANS
ncbi:hypothetical protein EV182_001226 [Spiromyces aspiralis]|uniref:Uncharacterized protein n=1 Tax=Spiromyces aspiralis TaxID=68401 RepID=A0ACC1HG76_9FUNG|nr:hypothetical protein EV182_001226 [Spiromyces aspiralis]